MGRVINPNRLEEQMEGLGNYLLMALNVHQLKLSFWHCKLVRTGKEYFAHKYDEPRTRGVVSIRVREGIRVWSIVVQEDSSIFLDSLTVQFRWHFDKWFITCCYSLWTVEIWIGYLQLEIYITHNWLFGFPKSMIINGWLRVLKCWHGLDWWMYIYKYVDVWLMSMFLAVLVEPCWIYKSIYVSSNVWCYKCVQKATIDDITMTECCMIIIR